MLTKREIGLVASTVLLMCIPIVIIAHRNAAPQLPSTVFDYSAIKSTPTKVGEKRQFCDNPTKTLQNLEIHESSLNPGEIAHPPHQHPEEELTVLRQGTVEVLVNGELKRCGPGSVIFQSSNDLHNIKNVGKDVAIYHAIKWKTDLTPVPVAK
ncbi:cupin domain-containing protein [Mucilaginibacter sp. HMF5004]|uniref:cupin domain-containing protein n=1 Tax=Mucilaginibacter rivuli TaxID=2857527 RepID=UPI001C5D2509|nr:cupin domain-containing protein [Mucilaginibacter rivuli]MBW4889764.1 cupin domain-containing protein [Mucilaginibacter rivuli]